MSQAGPLEGISVVDFSQILAGPFCTMLLADMGAEVIKVERPNGGDDTRRFGPPFINGEGAAFLTLNRNKRSIVLDMKNEQGVEIAKKLVAEADVLVQNFRPGVLERLGLGYEAVKAINPAMVYCTISGFGITGPYKSKGGFDLVAQGMSGLMSITGFPGSPPAKVGVPIADFNTGLYSAYAILSAYIHMLKTGKGQHIDVSLMESAIAYTLYESATYFATGEVSGPLGSAHRMIAPYQAFATRDGHVNIGAANQANWERMCKAVGRDELLEDERFTTNADRMAHIEELTEIMNQTFATRTTEDWVTTLEAANVPCGPIYDIGQVYADPQVKAREMEVEIDHPVAGRIKNIGVPVKLSDTPGSIRFAAPTLGQHTDEILGELGFSADEIAKMHESGAVV
ncbi:MAG: CoA transferase [Chloroflexi bacterium]|nr:CoA transferase [Chloroflexota bacterium]